MKKWPDPRYMGQVRLFYSGLDRHEAYAFDAAVEMLRQHGPTLARPVVGEIDLREYSATIRAELPHLKELRLSTIRVLFTFGPDRVPVLLFAGDKRGDWSKWYPKAVKAAAENYRAYKKARGLR